LVAAGVSSSISFHDDPASTFAPSALPLPPPADTIFDAIPRTLPSLALTPETPPSSPPTL